MKLFFKITNPIRLRKLCKKIFDWTNNSGTNESFEKKNLHRVEAIFNVLIKKQNLSCSPAPPKIYRWQGWKMSHEEKNSKLNGQQKGYLVVVRSPQNCRKPQYLKEI